MIYFVSDLHFHHSKIIDFCPDFRGQFKNVEEMNKGLIKIWNDKIKEDDIVYNLGDFSFSKNITHIVETLYELNGEHHFILGNHDHLIMKYQDQLLSNKKKDGKPLISSIQHYKELRIDNKKLVLFHYPIYEWNSGHYNAIHLHGHVHDKTLDLKGKILNVCLDHQKKILSFEEVLDLTKDMEKIIHHKQKRKF